MISDLTLWLFHAMFFGEVVFVVMYAVIARGGNGRIPWWRSAVGRALMTMSVGLALTLFISEVGYWTAYQLPHWVTNLALGIITLGIYERLIAFARLARRGHHDRLISNGETSQAKRP